MSDAPGTEVTHPQVVLGARVVGEGCAPYVIAELSANHRGSLEWAEGVVRAAAAAGADAIKLQTYTAGSMTLAIDRPPFIAGDGTQWAGRTLYDLYEEAHTPWDWHKPLFNLAAQLGLHCFSSPFSRDAVDFLEQLDPPAYKIASFELLDLDLIGYAASTGRPLIISTGMATLDEIDEAVTAARAAGAGGVVLLRCNSAYPAHPIEMDLRSITAMRERWAVPIGLSDHTLTNTAAIVAAGLGASVFEKHLTLDRAAGGPDASFSIEPTELAELIGSVHEASVVRGAVRFGPSPAEVPSLAFRRSLYVVEDVASGAELTAANVRAIRPSGGLAPKHLIDVLGRRTRRSIQRGEPLRWEDLA